MRVSIPIFTLAVLASAVPFDAPAQERLPPLTADKMTEPQKRPLWNTKPCARSMT